MRRRDFISIASGAALGLATTQAFAQGSTEMAALVTHDIVVTRLFDATPMEVWKAWTTDAEVMKWWGPDTYTAPVARMDVRVGGTSLVAMRSPDGQEHWMTWVYTVVEPGKRLEYVQNLSSPDGGAVDPTSVGMPPEFPRDVVTVVTLTPRGEQTEVTISEHTTTSEFMMKMSRMGLEQVMDKMGGTFAK
jgi:uncharacterized protein YndB with AHSA1/START domain